MKNITRDDVARAAGVAPSTVSRALSDSPLLPAATRERIQVVAREMGYLPNASARRLASQRSFQLAFAVPFNPLKGALRQRYFTETLDAAVTVAAEHGCDVSVSQYRGDDAAGRMADLWRSQRIDGILLPGVVRDSSMPAALRAAGVPTVLVGCHDSHKSTPFVDWDIKPGLEALVAHAARTGLRRVLYIHGDLRFSNARDQRRIFRAACKRHGIAIDGELAGNYSLRTSERLVGQWIDEHAAPPWIYAANDRSAVGVYQACQERSLLPGHDVAIAGFDDDDLCRVVTPHLASVRQDRQEVGTLAVERLLQLIAGEEVPSATWIPTTFIDRPSFARSGHGASTT